MKSFSNNVRTSSEDFLIEACANKKKTGANILTKEEIEHIKFHKKDSEKRLAKFEKGVKCSRNCTYNQRENARKAIENSVLNLKRDIKIYSFLLS